MSALKELRRRIFVDLAVFAGTLAFRLLGSTWRVRTIGDDLPRLERAAGRRFIGAFWHNRILGFCWQFRGLGLTTLISRHRDGEIIARIAENLGHRSARGSSTRGAIAGLRSLIAAAREGDIGITPDGPRGPCYCAAGGVAEVAARVGRPILAASWAVDRAWRLPSWDRFIVPKPFARIEFRYRVVEIPTGTEEAPPDHEAARVRLEAALRDLTREAEDALTGAHDPRLDAPPEEPWDEATAPPKKPRAPREPLSRALLVCAVAAALLWLAPALLRGPGGPDPRADLCLRLLLAAGLAATLPPGLLLGSGAKAVLGLGAGLLLGVLAPAALLGRGLAGSALLGLLVPGLLAATGASLAGLLRSLRAAPLLAALPGAALVLSIFAAGPLLSLAEDPGAALAILLHASAVTSLAGSLLEIDLLRTAPLYQLVPTASEGPFRYPDFGATLLAPGALAVVAIAARRLVGRRPDTPAATPEP